MSTETSPEQIPPSERSAVIDLSAITANVRRLRELAQGRTFIAVLKADAYGHGAAEIAQAVLDGGADMIGVAHVAEALALRDRDVSAPLLAWLHTPSTDFRRAIEEDVQLGVSGPEFDAVLAAAQHTGTRARIHLKVDTGLGRNGATSDDWPALLERIAAAQDAGQVEVVGLFTHLAVADEPERRAETQEQLDLLTQAVDTAKRHGVQPQLVHAANTPGLLSAERFADPADMLRDAVRVGLGVYGLSPFEDVPPAELGLTPAMTVRAQVANVKAVPAGQGVSYGYSYRTEAPTHLGLIPLGYADGVPRIATGAPVQINDRTYPVVGRIAMDQCVVDLSRGFDLEGNPLPVPGEHDEPAVLVGDEAILFGPPPFPSAGAWGQAAGTINYEVVTRISPRVPREYAGGEVLEPVIGDAASGAFASPSGVVPASVSSQHPGAGAASSAGETGDDAAPGASQAHGEDTRWSLTRHPATPEQMQELARTLAPYLEAGDLVMLNGELGAGKTTFTQGLAEGLGVRAGVISPTFVISRRHPNLPDGPRAGGPGLVHVDAYRVTSAADMDSVDLETTQPTSVTVVEWGTGKVEHLSESRLVIDIERAVGGTAAPPRTDVGDTDEEVRAALAALTREWDEESEGGDEVRTVILRGFGPRWEHAPQL